MITFHEALNNNKNEFIVLNVNVSDLNSHFDCKGTATLRAYGFTVDTLTTSICFYEGWLMVNMKISYLKYEVDDDKFRSWTVTGLNPITSNLSDSCFYFE